MKFRVAAAMGWLKTDDCMVLDVFNPFKAALASGQEKYLQTLEIVPGSVRLVNRQPD